MFFFCWEDHDFDADILWNTDIISQQRSRRCFFAWYIVYQSEDGKGVWGSVCFWCFDEHAQTQISRINDSWSSISWCLIFGYFSAVGILVVFLYCFAIFHGVLVKIKLFLGSLPHDFSTWTSPSCPPRSPWLPILRWHPWWNTSLGRSSARRTQPRGGGLKMGYTIIASIIHTQHPPETMVFVAIFMKKLQHIWENS